jgi:hypothetical protein
VFEMLRLDLNEIVHSVSILQFQLQLVGGKVGKSWNLRPCMRGPLGEATTGRGTEGVTAR